MERVLEHDVLPDWEGRDARTITPREVVELLDEIVARGSRVMAKRTAGLLGQLFKFGIQRAIVVDSPVKLLYRPGGREKPRERAFRDEELKAFLRNLDDACRFQKLPHVLRLSRSNAAGSLRLLSGVSSTSRRGPGPFQMRMQGSGKGPASEAL